MLTPPNEALAARDAALPGLGLLLDRAALAEELGTVSVELRHLRYKPGTSCAAAVVTEDGRWLRLRALTPERHAEKGSSGPSALAAACIEAGSPAGDRDVPGLRRLWPEKTRGKAMARLFGEGRLATARLVPLSYRLGRRLVARLEHPDGAALLKVHAPGRFAQAQAGAVAAALAGHAPMERACARTLAVVTRWLPGETLSAARGPAGFAEAGGALAVLHAGPPVLPFPRSRADEVAAVARALGDAATLLPDMGERLGTLADRLALALAGTPAEPGPIHGDFSADQVVIGADGARLIDWDRAGTGDMAADLGSALARLDADRLAGRLMPETARTAADALLAGYAARRVLPPAVEAQRLAHLAGLATEPFRRQALDWPAGIAALVTEIERGLDGLGVVGPADPALPHLGTLLSPSGAQALLDAAGAGRLVAPPRLMRHKEGRRAMVELVADGGTWLAKTRSKRPDHATPALHQALRAAGFDGREGLPFAIPAIRGGAEGTRTVLMARVPGRPLAAWQEPGADPAPFRATGRALAALHACAIDPERSWSAEDEAAVALRALDAAAARHPGMADRIAPLRARAAALPGSGRPAGAALLHRDFYPDQALVDGGRIWLIDLDLAARGDAHVDLGNMLAHLTEYAIRHHGDAHALDQQEAAFLDGYSEDGGRWCDTALAELRAISLMRHLDLCGRLPGRSHAFAGLLEHLETPSRCRIARVPS